jgi:hypothetical protein
VGAGDCVMSFLLVDVNMILMYSSGFCNLSRSFDMGFFFVVFLSSVVTKVLLIIIFFDMSVMNT